MNLEAGGTGKGLWLANARVPADLVEGFEGRDHDPRSGLVSVDCGIAPDGTFTAPLPGGHRIDLEGRILLPTFIDSHVHLDKAYTVRRAGIPTGGLLEAVRLCAQDAANWTERDLEERMDRALTRAWHNGTSALRSHLDTPVAPARNPSWKVFNRLREKWRGRLALQPVALMALERVDDTDDYTERCRQIGAMQGVLGAFIAPGMATPERLDKLFELAERFELDVDFHVDETLDPASRGLELICDSVERIGFGGRVLAGHCCSLGTMDDRDRERIIAKAARSGVRIVSLPASNLFLQDRAAGMTPRRRGVTAARELRAAGASVHFASDNVQDPFYPYGDYDLMEVFGLAVRAAHLDADIGTWLAGQFTEARLACGFAGHGRLTIGGTADAIIFEARDLVELMSGSCERLVIRKGEPVRPRQPALSTLFAPEYR